MAGARSAGRGERAGAGERGGWALRPAAPAPARFEQLLLSGSRQTIGCAYLLIISIDSLLTHRLVLLCIDTHCFVFWDLPGGVLAAPAPALCGWTGVRLPFFSLLLSSAVICALDALSVQRVLLIWNVRCVYIWYTQQGKAAVSCFWDVPGDVLAAPASALCGWTGVTLSLPFF